MTDGSTEVTDHEMTESNRMVIKSFVEDVLIHRHHEKLDDYINQEHYVEHNSRFGDDLIGLRAILSKSTNGDSIPTSYVKCHRLLAEGNFVLSVCEGYVDQIPTSFFDLFRLKGEKIAEHWDTTETIPPHSEWKNNNGKF